MEVGRRSARAPESVSDRTSSIMLPAAHPEAPPAQAPRGAGNHVFHPVLAQSQSSPTWRSQKGLVFGLYCFVLGGLSVFWPGWGLGGSDRLESG